MSHGHWESDDASKAHTSPYHQHLIMWWIQWILDGLGLFTPGLHHNHCLSWILTLAPTLYYYAVSLFECFYSDLRQLQWIAFTLQGIRWSPQADICSCPWGIDHRGALPNWKADHTRDRTADQLQIGLAFKPTDTSDVLTAALIKAGISLIPAKGRLTQGNTCGKRLTSKGLMGHWRQLE